MSEGYDGTVHLPVTITPPANAAVGSSVELKVKVDALVCDPKSCMPFVKEVALTPAHRRRCRSGRKKRVGVWQHPCRSGKKKP
jgi:DsbC/DsbD-like thiol-disulfide interchange protein